MRQNSRCNGRHLPLVPASLAADIGGEGIAGVKQGASVETKICEGDTKLTSDQGAQCRNQQPAAIYFAPYLLITYFGT